MSDGLKKRSFYGQLAVIFVGGLILLLPQYIGKEFIIGSDAIFHFNRFYDTSQQIKEGNLQYFLSIYGFQQSGRIVNALYGPLFAYFHGLLVLVSSSWFHYQLLSNGILYIVAGYSMYGFLKKVKVDGWLAVWTSLLFMTTYSIQYWVERQGFSAWGAAVFPLCLIPAVELIQQQKIRPIFLGAAIALMFQIHVLSSVFLVLVYIPFFLLAFIESQNKKQLVLSLIEAIGVFALLSLNILLSLVDLNSHNELKKPFINQNMDRNTITGTSKYWLFTPWLLPVILGATGFFTWKNWRKLSKYLKTMIGTGTVFLILSTNLIPWKTLTQSDNPLITIIQFPFRFFVPATVLLLISFSVLIFRHTKKSVRRTIALAILLGISFAGALIENTQWLEKWQDDAWVIRQRKHTYVLTEDAATFKAAFFSTDKAQALTLIQRSTPDYLPLYEEDNKNKYDAYAEQIIQQDERFKKTVRDGRLTVSWQADKAGPVEVPVIKYYRTTLSLNGQQLSENNISLSNIGTVTVQQKAGENQLVLDYKSPTYFKWALGITVAAWVTVGVFFILRIKRS